MNSKATILQELGFQAIQVIDYIKIFFLLMFIFLLRHSYLSLNKLKELGIFLRKIWTRKSVDALTKEAFYIRAKDGGFGMYSLHERYHLC
jgi:hypothetical protein